MSNTSLSLAGLDFDAIKLNLKQFLSRSDSPFKDYNFEGSNISQLLDILSYNTYLNSFYLNMVASEMFIDSAQLRDSVSSHAKALGYVPRSFKSATALVSFTVTPSTPTGSLLIPKGTTFTTKVGSNNYTFSTQENVAVDLSPNGIFNIESLKIYEGIYVTDTFVFDSSNNTQRFVISNPTVDTDSINVIVIEDNGANSTTYSIATSFLGVTNTSPVFFLQAAENSQYELVFGDNVIGRRPKNGAVIAVDYRICNGQLPNGASFFDIDGTIQGETASSITTVEIAGGGDVNETIEQIKFHAPRFYQNQDRAITTSDYENILKVQFPEISAASAQGGEEKVPPEYGKVYIAVDIKDADGLSEINKKKYYDYIKQRCSVNITPVFVNPRFLYLEVYSIVKYDTSRTSIKSTDVISLVKARISKYNKEFLNDFNTKFYYSKFINDIDLSNANIVSNSTDVIPYKIFTPTQVSLLTRIALSFNYPIATKNTLTSLTAANEEYSVFSSVFKFDGAEYFIEDDGAGALFLKNISPTGGKIEIRQCGEVDYINGTVTINELNVDAYSGAGIKVYAVPASKDLIPSKDTILKINDEDVFITVEAKVNG